MAKLAVTDSDQCAHHIRVIPSMPPVYIITPGLVNEYYADLDQARLAILASKRGLLNAYPAGSEARQGVIALRRAIDLLQRQPGDIDLRGHIVSCSERLDITCDSSCDGCSCHA